MSDQSDNPYASPQSDYMEAEFNAHVESTDPDYADKRRIFQEMRELRDKIKSEEGIRGRRLRKRVQEEMEKRYAGDGKILRIIQILLSIFSIVLFFI